MTCSIFFHQNYLTFEISDNISFYVLGKYNVKILINLCV